MTGDADFMDFVDVFEDTVKCQHCGTPTPRLYPPVDIELCDSCWRAREQDFALRQRNEAVVTNHIKTFLGKEKTR